MYILSHHPSPILFCSTPGNFNDQPETRRVTSPAENYLDEMLQAGFSLKLLAKQSKISSSTLYRLTKGKIKNPTYKTFKRLLKTYCRLIVLK